MSVVKKFDAVTPRPKYKEEGRVWWHRIGSAVENEKGQIAIYLDSVPVPDAKEGKVVIMLFEQREEDRDNPETRKSTRDAGARSRTEKRVSDIDVDEIPF